MAQRRALPRSPILSRSWLSAVDELGVRYWRWEGDLGRRRVYSRSTARPIFKIWRFSSGNCLRRHEILPVPTVNRKRRDREKVTQVSLRLYLLGKRATLRSKPNAQGRLMSNLRRRRFYREGVLDEPQTGRFHSSHPQLRAANRELHRLMNQIRPWEIHRFSQDESGLRTLEMCHLWRYREVSPDRWVCEHRRVWHTKADWVSSASQNHIPMPNIKFWPFLGVENNRSKHFLSALWSALWKGVSRLVCQRLGLKTLDLPDVAILREVVLKRWTSTLFKSSRLLMGLRCFVNEVWKQILHKRRFGSLVAIRGLSLGVNTGILTDYLHEEDHLRSWDDYPNLRPMLVRVMGVRWKGRPLASWFAPQDFGKWIRSEEGREFRLHQRKENPRDFLLPCFSFKEWKKITLAPATLVAAAFRECHNSLKKDGFRSTPFAYWRLPDELQEELGSLPVNDRAALLIWLSTQNDGKVLQEFCQVLLRHYIAQRLKDKPVRGRWPNASLSKTNERVRNTIEVARWRFSKDRLPSENWLEELQRDHPWVIQARYDRLDKKWSKTTLSSPVRSRL